MILVAASNAVDGALEGGLRGAVAVGTVIVTALLIVAMFKLMFRGRAIVTPDGDLVMVYSGMNRFLMSVVLVFAGLIFVLALLVLAGVIMEPAALAILVPFGLFFGVGGAASLAESVRRLVVVSNSGVAGRRWVGELEEIAWGDITRIDYGNVIGAFKVYAGDRRVTVPVMLLGREAFMKSCRRHLDKSIYVEAFREAKKLIPK